MHTKLVYAKKTMFLSISEETFVWTRKFCLIFNVRQFALENYMTIVFPSNSSIMYALYCTYIRHYICIYGLPICDH